MVINGIKSVSSMTVSKIVTLAPGRISLQNFGDDGAGVWGKESPRLG